MNEYTNRQTENKNYISLQHKCRGYKYIEVIHVLKLGFNGLDIVEEKSSVHLQHVLKMSRCLYTGEFFEQNFAKNQ